MDNFPEHHSGIGNSGSQASLISTFSKFPGKYIGVSQKKENCVSVIFETSNEGGDGSKIKCMRY